MEYSEHMLKVEPAGLADGLDVGCEREGLRMTSTQGCRVSFWSNTNVLKLIVVMGTQLCEYTRSH